MRGSAHSRTGRQRPFAGALITALVLLASATCSSGEATPKKSPQGERYLFYLHGKIVEDKGVRPKSGKFGYYEYEKIVSTLREKGFTVLSEARPRNTDPRQYAEKVAAEIRELIKKGVPKSRITVVGASKGGVIALHVSNLLKERELNFVILAGLFKSLLKDPDLKLWGNVLSIHDSADTLPIAPEAFFERSKGLGRHKSIVTDLGLGHGLLYQPYESWVKPLLEWVK